MNIEQFQKLLLNLASEDKPMTKTQQKKQDKLKKQFVRLIKKN